MNNGQLKALTAFVVRLLEHPAVRSFYVGRTADPAARRAAHRCRAMLILATTETTADAIKTEAAILRALGAHAKRRNLVVHGGGGTPRRRHASAVYVALWADPPP